MSVEREEGQWTIVDPVRYLGPETERSHRVPLIFPLLPSIKLGWDAVVCSVSLYGQIVITSCPSMGMPQVWDPRVSFPPQLLELRNKGQKDRVIAGIVFLVA